MMVVPFLLLLVLVIVAAVIGSLVATKRNFDRRKLTGPVCGGCGYSVTGLTVMTCPECGKDLRTVGILTPSTPRGTSVVAGTIKFTLLLAFIAAVATAGVESVVPVRHTYGRKVRLGPMSNGYRSVLVQISRTSWSEDLSSAAVTIELEPTVATPAALPARMTVHADGGYEFTAGSRVLRQGIFGKSAVLEWLKAAGLDTSAADVQHKAARIAAEIRIAAHSGRAAMRQSSGSSFSSSSSSGGDPTGVFQTRTLSEVGHSASSPAAPIAMLGFWLAVWIWGLWYLVSRGTRSRRAVST